jgi:hypothetical protein
MSGGLLTDMLLRETGLRIDLEGSERLRHLHAMVFNGLSACIRPLPGARELLSAISPIAKSPGQS